MELKHLLEMNRRYSGDATTTIFSDGSGYINKGVYYVFEFGSLKELEDHLMPEDEKDADDIYILRDGIYGEPPEM